MICLNYVELREASFLAEDEIEALETLRQRLGLQGVLFNRSEVMRIALRHLAKRAMRTFSWPSKE